MKTKFCCESSRRMYEDYYGRQTGGEVPVFVGARRQRGHGLGSVLGGLFRSVVPFIKRNIGTIGKTLARTGMTIAGDVMSGRKLKESVKEHVPQGLKRTAESLDWESTHPGVRAVGSNLLKTGAAIAGDVIKGKRLQQSARQRIPKGIKRTVRSFQSQTGSGRRRRHIVKRDIFD